MKTTPFTDLHISLGAKMHEFGGYNMPIEYTGIMDEHLAVVNSVGVFDVSHMGEIWVKGPHALEFLQRVTSNDASVIPVGKAQYTSFTNEEGGIVDDFIVYTTSPKYMMVVNASNIQKDWEWCNRWNSIAGWKRFRPYVCWLFQGCAMATMQADRVMSLHPHYSFRPHRSRAGSDRPIPVTGAGVRTLAYPGGLKIGTPCSRRVRSSASSPLGWVRATRYASRWGSVFTGTS